MVWIFSGWSGKFPDSLESFQIVWKDFDDPEKSLIMPKAFRRSSNIFQENDFCTLFLSQKQFTHTCFVAKTIYATFFSQKKIHAHFFCDKNNFHTLFLLQKWFTHFVRKVFARWNLPSGKFRLFGLRGRPCTVYTSYVLTGFYVLFHIYVWVRRLICSRVSGIFQPCVCVYVCVSCIIQRDVCVCLGVHFCVPCDIFQLCVCELWENGVSVTADYLLSGRQ